MAQIQLWRHRSTTHEIERNMTVGARLQRTFKHAFRQLQQAA